MKGLRITLAVISIAWTILLLLVVFVSPGEDITNLLIVLPLASAALCYAQAGNLKLSTGGWAFAGLIFPFAAPLILALRKPAPDIEKMTADKDVAGLVAAVFDRRENLAGDAYVALRKMEPDETVPLLIQALPRTAKSSYGQTRMIVGALIGTGREEAVDSSLAVLRNRKFRNRAAVVYELMESKIQDQRLCQVLSDLLNEGTEILRQNAMQALGRLGCTSALEPLLTKLRRGPKKDRAVAAGALGELGDREAVEPLIQTLKAGNPSVRSSSAEALGKLRDQRALAPLLDALQKESCGISGKDPHWYLRHSIVEALGRLGNPSVCETVLERISDPNFQVRDAAAEAYAKLRRIGQETGRDVPAVEVVKCAGCGRWLRRGPLDALEILVATSPNISGTQVYTCKSCGADFCIDCMAKANSIAGGRQCPKCFRSSGW